MSYKKLFTLMAISACPVIFANSPFDINPILPLDMHGWFSTANQRTLERFINTIHPKKAVEIGTWLGLSAIFTAKLLDADAKLYCIDPWIPYHDMDSIPECQGRLNHAYEQFLSNCIHHQVTDKIIPMRMPSLQAVNSFSSDIDLIYIDGSHAEKDVYEDIMNWYPKLSDKGYMCGDDMGWPSVYAAVMQAAKELNVTVRIDNNVWWFEK